MDIARIRKKLKEERERAQPIPPEGAVPAVPDISDASGEPRGSQPRGPSVLNPEISEIEAIEAFTARAGSAWETRPEPDSGTPPPAPTPEAEPPVDVSVDVSVVVPGEAIYAPIAEVEVSVEAEELPIVELLTFRLSGGDDYAFRVLDLEEIIRPHHITAVPRSNPAVCGITAIRGKVVPVVDLENRLFGGKTERVSKVLVLRGPKGSIGASIEKGMDVIRVTADNIAEPPAHLTEEGLRFIEGVASHGGRFISIIRMEGLLDFNFRETLPEEER